MVINNVITITVVIAIAVTVTNVALYFYRVVNLRIPRMKTWEVCREYCEKC